MGAFTSLQLAINFPDRLRAVVAAGAGSGSFPGQRAQFLQEAEVNSRLMEKAERLAAEQMAVGPTRVQLLNKDPRGWRTLVDHLAEHPPAGSARVLRNVQGKRPSLYEQEAQLKAVKVPVLLMVGDEDEPCLDTNLFMKRIMPTAQLAVMPGSGHVLNCEEPALMNHLIERFLAAVDRGSWRPRDPRALPVAGSVFATFIEGPRSES
jgi:pimeloyl-ACP methyl ester carboxylesterase